MSVQQAIAEMMGPGIWDAEHPAGGPTSPPQATEHPGLTKLEVAPFQPGANGKAAAELASSIYGFGDEKGGFDPGSLQRDANPMENVVGDPAALMKRLQDRASAAQELRGLFQISNDPDVRNVSAGNVVSSEEFQRLVSLYSDIRMGETNIKLGAGIEDDAEKAAFGKAAMGDLARILQTRSGRELLQDLAWAKDKDGNDLTTEIGGMHVNPETGRAEPGTEVVGGAAGKARAQNGTGSSSYTGYTPGETWDLGWAHDSTHHGRWERSDVTLYHELAHAHHIHHGTAPESEAVEELATTGLDGQWGTFNENRYRHERRRIGQAEAVGGGVGAVGAEYIEGVEGVVDTSDVNMKQRVNYSGGEIGLRVPYLDN